MGWRKRFSESDESVFILVVEKIKAVKKEENYFLLNMLFNDGKNNHSD
jgi:hypothetical protein